MEPQPRIDKKWTTIYSLAIILLVASTYVLTLPLDTKLRFFCTIDGTHIAETPPTYHPIYTFAPDGGPSGYWTNPTTGTKLVVITIWVAIDTGMWLYYDNTENIFWIGLLTGPMKSAFYGPYPGILWTLTSLINPLALTGIVLSIIALIYQPSRRLWTKTHTTNIP
jgi:hypothetical protein